MAKIPVKKFTVESSVEFVADHFSAEQPNSDLLETASRSDRISIKMGLRTPDDDVLVTHLDSGRIDEYQLVILPDSQVSTIKGRDQAAALLENYFRKRYKHLPVLDTAVTDPRTGNTLAPKAVLSVTESFPVPEVSGYFTAKGIAQDVCDSVGLGLSWEVRDYSIQKDFDAAGRAIDIIKRLIEPWTIVEPFRADLFLQGNTLIVRHRQLPTALLVADYTYSVKGLKRGSVTIRKRPAKKVGIVTLRGMQVSALLSKTSTVSLGTQGIGGQFGGGQETRINSSTNFDGAGNVLSMVITTFTYQMPTNILLQQVKEVYEAGAGIGLTLTTRETIAYVWTKSTFSATGVVSSPLPLEKTTTTEGFDTTGVFNVIASETVESEYDDKGFMRAETTLKKALNPDTGLLENSEMTVRTLADMGPLLVHEIVEKSSPKKNDAGTQIGWSLLQRDEATQGGHRPGGPGRSVPKFSLVGTGVGTQNQLVNTVVQQQVNPDADAAPFDYTNENLSLDDLNFLMSLFVAADLLWEYEVIFKGPIIAHLLRGKGIQVTGVKNSKGVEISLPVLFITAINSAFDNSNEKSPTSMMDPIRGFGWRST